MAKGRRRELDEVVKARGNPGRRPVPASFAVPLPPVKDSAPPQLSDQARAIWGRIAPDLAKMNFFRATDRETLARYSRISATGGTASAGIADIKRASCTRRRRNMAECCAFPRW